MKNKTEDLRDEIEYLEEKCRLLASIDNKGSELLSMQMRLARLYNQIDNLSMYKT